MCFLRRLIVSLELGVLSWRDAVEMAVDGWLCYYGPCPARPCGLPSLAPVLRYVDDNAESARVMTRLVVGHLYRHLAPPPGARVPNAAPAARAETPDPSEGGERCSSRISESPEPVSSPRSGSDGCFFFL